MTAVVEPAQVEGRAPLEREWPAWAVPARAVGEWVALQAALRVLGEAPVCADDPDRWFSTAPAEVEWARFGCAACPVVEVCRAYSLAADERSGTWGGLSEVERRAIAGRRR